jgi:hypothetical protein
MRIFRYLVDMKAVPVDFFADPDGAWDFTALVEAAGFDPENPEVTIGALSDAFEGHPDGSAVVTRTQAGRAYIAVIECVERQEPVRIHPHRSVEPVPMRVRAA